MLQPNVRLISSLGLALRLMISVLLLAATMSEIPQAQEKGSEQGFAILRSSDLAAMLERKDFLLVNVHIPYEGEIANTDAFIPYDKIADNLDKLPKGAKIVLYCRSGRMSEIAAQALIQLGYARISHLAGGMNDWKQNGYQIIER